MLSVGVVSLNDSPCTMVWTFIVAVPAISAISVYGTPPVVLSSVKLSTELSAR